MKKDEKFSLRVKLLIGLFLTVVLVVAAITVSITGIYRLRMETYYKGLAEDIDDYFAKEITSEEIKRYSETKEKDDRYEEIHRRMNTAIEEYSLNSLYIIIPNETKRNYTYIFDGASYDDPAYCEIGSEDTFYAEDGFEMLLNVWNGGESKGSVSNSAKYGYLVSVARAIKDDSGKSVAAVITDISIDMVNNEIREIVISTVSLAFGLALVAMALYYFFIRKIVISPILRLEKAANEFPFSEDEEGNLRVTKERYRSGDEIGSLFRAVVEMEQSIVSFMSNLKSITAERERIGAELNVATEIQASTLPSVFPPYPDRKEFDIYAMMHPAKEVGGDFYDFFFIDDNHFCMVIADVSGKGVGAAMFMMISKTFINGQAHMELSPARVLAEVNDRLCENNLAEMFVTVWIGILDVKTGIMTASNGGHEYPFIQRAGGEYEMLKDKHGPGLGVCPGIKYSEYEIQFNKGDAIFVYTDGVAEATDKDNVLFGTDRALASLNTDPDSDMADAVDNLKKGIDDFVQDAPQFDDITMLALRYFGNES